MDFGFVLITVDIVVKNVILGEISLSYYPDFELCPECKTSFLDKYEFQYVVYKLMFAGALIWITDCGL